MYYNRRVHTKELAERVACVTAEDLKQASAKVYRDVNVNMDLWLEFACVLMGECTQTTAEMILCGCALDC